MCELIGAADLSEKQFSDGAERLAVGQTLAERFRRRTLGEWEALLENEDLPITGVKTVSEVVRDPHVKARGLLPVVDVSGLGKVKVIAHPAKYTASETRNPTRVPARGQDTEEILRSLGYTARQIQTLAKKGVVAV
jgi:crotonobetainyl-CoA:carnitine CoA-transferase CaiB-like acyl-CoA transferase